MHLYICIQFHTEPTPQMRYVCIYINACIYAYNSQYTKKLEFAVNICVVIAISHAIYLANVIYMHIYLYACIYAYNSRHTFVWGGYG